MSAFSDFQDEEVIQTAVWPPDKKLKILSLHLPTQLTDRRIYVYLEVNQAGHAASTFYIAAEIVLYNNGEIQAKYPVEIGINAFPTSSPLFNKTLRCVANAGGSPVGDCLTLVLNKPFTTLTQNAVIQPIRVNGQCDSAVLNFIDWAGVNNTGYRVYMGILSQNQ